MATSHYYEIFQITICTLMVKKLLRVSKWEIEATWKTECVITGHENKHDEWGWSWCWKHYSSILSLFTNMMRLANVKRLKKIPCWRLWGLWRSGHGRQPFRFLSLLGVWGALELQSWYLSNFMFLAPLEERGDAFLASGLLSCLWVKGGSRVTCEWVMSIWISHVPRWKTPDKRWAKIGRCEHRASGIHGKQRG